MGQIVSKSKFKPHALEYFREIEEKGGEIIITSHGQPVLKIIPYEEEDPKDALKSLRNTVLKYESPMDSIGGKEWEALK